MAGQPLQLQAAELVQLRQAGQLLQAARLLSAVQLHSERSQQPGLEGLTGQSRRDCRPVVATCVVLSSMYACTLWMKREEFLLCFYSIDGYPALLVCAVCLALGCDSPSRHTGGAGASAACSTGNCVVCSLCFFFTIALVAIN